MTSNSIEPLSNSDAVDYEIARAKDLAFDAVHSLWRRRQSEGVNQIELAQKLDRDEAWVSRNLRGPGNWTVRTLAKFAFALDGELAINLFALEDPPATRDNYHAYAELDEFLRETETANTDLKKTFKEGRLQSWEPDLVVAEGGQVTTFVEFKTRAGK